MLRQASSLLSIRAAEPGLHEFTDSIAAFVHDSGIQTGLLTIFCRHTSASLLIQENAAPAARRDL
jgi:secondary thiamine-phosphate synthase enzyme